ncbi:hypothetical protein C4J95_5309 [Pseudomonas orientalis]|uniref:hypothetical protein n=1 Tax=Pseudomonas orientalis TaxID=76758 RepID=UPI000F58F0E2|nr:hypothetical protein [Pseudomonas orientalis]AZF02723.1 hypothetical protein C4J95_5309 [Pseudomonas orientalis]
MSPDHRNRQVHNILDQWLRDGQIDPTAHSHIGELYPLSRWDWRSLGRWFLTFGAISFATGLLLFLREHLTFTLPALAISLSALTLGLFVVGRWLPGKGLRMLGSTAELLGGFVLISMSFVVGMIYSDGSGNWPALLLIDLLALLMLSYALGNVLLLTLCGVVFFVWFGGRSGYASDWGSYWFGMNYPLRFLGAAAVLVAAGALHLRCEAGLLARYSGFANVWISCGLFVGEMSLWLLSLFGRYDLIYGPWHFAEHGELLMFNMLWALVSLGVLTVGLRQRFGMLVGYGVTFLIIQFYTLFFTQLAETLGWLLSLLVAGGSLLVLVILLDSQRQKRRRMAHD